MSEPSKAAIERAARLITEGYRSEGFVNFAYTVRDIDSPLDRAFARFIDHVSDFAKRVKSVASHHGVGGRLQETADQFILSDPEPDVLEQSMRELEWTNCDTLSADLRTELAKRGYEIRKVQP